jgi:hypothetical protein
MGRRSLSREFKLVVCLRVRIRVSCRSRYALAPLMEGRSPRTSQIPAVRPPSHVVALFPFPGQDHQGGSNARSPTSCRCAKFRMRWESTLRVGQAANKISRFQQPASPIVPNVCFFG